MRISCIHNRGVDLPPYYLQHANFRRTKFDVVIGATYNVYAVFIWDNGVTDYLIDPHADGRPNFYPSSLFTVADGTLPAVWVFDRFPDTGRAGFLLGYPELADPRHFDGIQLREGPDLRQFAERKRQIDRDAEG